MARLKKNKPHSHDDADLKQKTASHHNSSNLDNFNKKNKNFNIINNIVNFIWDLFLFTKKKHTKNSTDLIRQRRSRVYAKSILLISSLSIAAITIIIALFAGLPQKIFTTIIEHCIVLSGKYGMDLKEVNIKGRKETSIKQINSIVNATLKTPILQYDLEKIRAALLENPWIKKASVHRRLPNVLLINIQERSPIALWQDKKNHYLVDSDGVVMNASIPNSYKTLPIVAGKGAPTHTPRVLSLIEKFPNIAERTSGLIRIRERRWNLTLDKSITVKLPEEGIQDSLARLSFLMEKNPLSKEHIIAIDLRHPDQIFIKMTEQASKILQLSSKTKTKI